MPDHEKKNSLQETLAQKTTRELENMLVEDFAADAEPNAEMIRTVMEVMRDKKAPTEEELQKTEAARQRFLSAIHDKPQSEAFSQTGNLKERSHEHNAKTEQSQNSRKSFRFPLRYLLIAAILAILVAGTAMGRNWFSIIAQWTAETFRFDTGCITAELPKVDALDQLMVSVERKTSTPVAPVRAPEGTEMVGSVSVVDRPDNCRIRANFIIGDREFTIQYTIHDIAPDDISGTYQRDEEIQVIHEAGGVKHYITGNYQNLSVMWINGTVEGHIQGELTLEELKAMLDSIYEE